MDAATHADAAGASGAQRRETFEDLLDRICSRVDCETGADAAGSLRIADLLEAVGRRAYGPLLFLTGLISISPVTIVPGMTWLFALITILIAVQMAIGLPTPWLPGRLLRMNVPAGPLVRGVGRARPWARRIDRVLKPRLTFLSHPPFANLVALAVIAAALATFPLGLIPFGPVAPGLAITLLGLGVAAKDGFVITLGVAMVAGAGLLVVRLVG